MVEDLLHGEWFVATWKSRNQSKPKAKENNIPKILDKDMRGEKGKMLVYQSQDKVGPSFSLGVSNQTTKRYPHNKRH